MYLHPNSIVHKVDPDLAPSTAVMFNPIGAGFRWAVEIPRTGPGDTVVMFSDGLTELRRGDEQYGRARVIESIKRHAKGTAEDMLEGIFRDALDWSQGDDMHPDDVTVAVLRADT